MPQFNPIDPTAEAGKAITGNIANFDNSSKLAGMANTFNMDQLQSMLRKAIPGYDQMTQQAGKNINSEMAGQLPSDVANQISRTAAQRSVSGGFAGSGFANNLQARDLGLTSLNLTQQGLDSATKWIATARSSAIPAMTDASSMFITPAQQLAQANADRAGKFQRDWVSNQLDAQYSLGTIAGQAMIKTDDQMMQMVSSLLGSLGGAAKMGAAA